LELHSPVARAHAIGQPPHVGQDSEDLEQATGSISMSSLQTQ